MRGGAEGGGFTFLYMALTAWQVNLQYTMFELFLNFVKLF